jgi:serine/threonine-protein kinase
LPDTPSTHPDDHPELSGEETVRREARKDTLAASGGSEFRHGRFEPGQRLGERYRMVARLGQGGMGEVYRADDLELGQSVALKFLPQRVAADPAWLRRFRNEVRTAREVAHANVCRIYDIAEEDGHVFLSMEYIDGEDLAGVLRRLGRPSREKAIEIARQICLGLAAAHENKVLHRDLKPANIMIDGRGRVRITDFGLAGFLDDLEQAEARAGTPAYMAPEQLTQGKVSVRSDIYTLGLILHELFTGRSVFETDDIEELKRKHTSGSVTPPSTLTEEIDPAVERVIMRCLEQAPEQRPQSVYQVLAALPGGDPLAAALAAGETPSPELVANARDAGGLRPAVAISLVAVMLACIALTCLVSSKTTVMPERAPARLSVVAEQIMEELGFGDLPRYSVSGYDGNAGLWKSLREGAISLDQLGQSTWPPKFRYWRRWSDGGFLPTDNHFPEQLMIDAPTNLPGSTATVALDSTGRLLALSVPPAIAGSASAATGDIDWLPVFECAQLNPDHAIQITPDLAPTVFCDTVVAWRIDLPSEGQDSVTVLMGAVGGWPNYFEYVGLHDDMLPNHAFWKGGPNVIGFAWMVFNVFMVLLAYRNLRAGRADHRNAFRCALFVGGLYATMEVVSIALGGSDTAGRVIGLTSGRAVGHFLQHAIEAWLYYLAIEPYVRRVWPRMLIGLVRVFSGRWRDPAIGREVLIGLVAGCVLVAVLTLVATADRRMTADSTAHLAHPLSLRIMLSPGHYLSNRAHVIAWAVLEGVSYAGVVVIIRLLARHAVTSAGLSIAAIGFLDIGLYLMAGDSSWAAPVYALGVGACLVWLYTRVGVLAAIVFFFVIRSMGLFALAFDAWSTPYLLSWLATLLAVAAYGFWVSLAGQSIFKDMLAEPQPAP